MNKLLLLCLLSIMIIYAQCINCEGAIKGNDADQVESCDATEIIVSSPTKKCVENDGVCHETALPCLEGHIVSGGLQSCDGLPTSDSENLVCIKKDDDCVEVKLCSKAKKGDNNIEKCEGFPVSNSKNYICAEIKDDKDGKCEEVKKPSTTNSGNILNAFKITFALIIIFTIL